ncbi:YIP1 family protein [Borreliella valaisiana]|uniref:YIP1 family protein n=1 Tax=Borreliella valaisiana TaxID=62088 RepID=UPI001AEFA4CE|nr:YIP1 family protein [Borreliella valaisiana]
MNLFLLTSLPLILKIYMNTQFKQSKTKNIQAHALVIFLAITIFSFLYLTQEFILYKSFELNYTSRITLGISIFIKEHLYYYIFPLLIFIFFFTLNENSSFRKNLKILIYFAFGLIFSKNLEIVILNSKIFGIYEYIELPILNAIELIFSAIIFEKTFKKCQKYSAKEHKIILSPILFLGLFIATLKTLILTNMGIYALTIFALVLIFITINNKYAKKQNA